MLKKFFATVVSVLLIVSLGFAFDKTSGTFNEFIDPESNGFVLTQSLVTVYTTGTAYGSEPVWNLDDKTVTYRWSMGTFGMVGSGFVVKGVDNNIYIITAAHCVDPKVIEIPTESPNFFMVTVPYVIIDRIIMVGNYNSPLLSAQILYLNTEYDMAILKVNGPTHYLVPLNYDVSYTYDPYDPETTLNENDAIALLVHRRLPDGSFAFEYEARYGKVIAPRPYCPDVNAYPWFNLHDVTIDPIGIPGDSGSPVFAFKNGKPVLIGIFRAAWRGAEQYGYFVRIDLVKRYLDTTYR